MPREELRSALVELDRQLDAAPELDEQTQHLYEANKNTIGDDAIGVGMSLVVPSPGNATNGSNGGSAGLGTPTRAS